MYMWIRVTNREEKNYSNILWQSSWKNGTVEPEETADAI
jgi:hypothetical protein